MVSRRGGARELCSEGEEAVCAAVLEVRNQQPYSLFRAGFEGLQARILVCRTERRGWWMPVGVRDEFWPHSSGVQALELHLVNLGCH